MWDNVVFVCDKDLALQVTYGGMDLDMLEFLSYWTTSEGSCSNMQSVKSALNLSNFQ